MVRNCSESAFGQMIQHLSVMQIIFNIDQRVVQQGRCELRSPQMAVMGMSLIYLIDTQLFDQHFPQKRAETTFKERGSFL